MKKILPLLMVAMLVVCIAVPAFASVDSNGNLTVQFKDSVMEFYSSDNVFDKPGQVFTTVDISFGEVYCIMSETPIIGRDINGKGIYLSTDTTRSNPYVFTYEEFSNLVAFDSATDPAHPTTFTFMVEEPFCDGSTCSVADYNMDNICDTCGATLAYSVQRSYTPNNYPSNLPVMPLGFSNDSHYVVLVTNGNTYLHVFTPLTSDVIVWNTTATSSNFRVASQDTEGMPVYTQYNKYQLVNGDWNSVESSQSKNSTTLGPVDGTEFIYSTLDIYESDGTRFFPIPLWAQTMQVTQGGMTQLSAEVVGAMKILTLCGVGCLALLVVLKLFGKRSLIYRN